MAARKKGAKKGRKAAKKGAKKGRKAAKKRR
jgi:hypothetical protein